jgi:peptide/nickel transport system permease protein
MAVSQPVLTARERMLRLRGLGRLERFGLAVLILVTVVAVLAPLLAPYGPTDQVKDAFLRPGPGGLLGTDDLGRDLFSRVLYGMRSSWFSALIVVAFGVVIGGVVGLVAGVFGGWVDSALMRITDLALALPGPVLAIAVIVALGPSLKNTLIAVSIVWWPWYARIVRGEARALMVRPHIDAARLSGVGRTRLALRHLLPGIVPPVLITASLDLGALVLVLAGLSFIGLGASPPAPELGAMAATGVQYLLGTPWIPLAPAAAVTVLAAAANLAGDALRDLLEDV